MSFTFCLGSDRPGWLSSPGLFDPGTRMFYSFNTLVHVRDIRPSVYDVDMDSGGFTRLLTDGSWDRWPPAAFVREVRRIRVGLQRLGHVAIQDWMCEPVILKKTGLSVAEHQRRTVSSYLTLLNMAPDVSWMPVLQGWERDDYFRCVELYAAAGVSLPELPVVGVGSTCRRHATGMVEDLVASLSAAGLKNLHMLGMKTDGLRRCVRHVARSDSFAWSYAARVRHERLPECRHGKLRWRKKLGRDDYGSCAHCPLYARRWYDQQIAVIRRALSQPIQQQLFAA